MNTLTIIIMITSCLVLTPPTEHPAQPQQPEIIIIEDNDFNAAESDDVWQDYCDFCDGYIGNEAHYVYQEEFLVCMECYRGRTWE